MDDNLFPATSPVRTTPIGCYAALPGSGPANEICARCSLLAPDGNRFVCGKYQALARKKARPISPNSSACKYFEPRRRFNQGAV
jgi:hypothetical protein